MLPRASRSRSARLAPITALALLAVLLTPSTTPAAQAASVNPVTPGNFTGLGFDQCEAPSQKAMTTWRASSPFQAVGIYISGASRYCKAQKNLTPTWVSTQLAAGWHLMPIHLGPQAACNTRYTDRGDVTIHPKAANNWSLARAQGKTEAQTAVSAAKALGISPGSTIFYDLEGFSLNHSTNCRQSALWFLSSWSNMLHRLGYLAGVYSSAGSGIIMLDDARQSPLPGLVLPDQLWIADWSTTSRTAGANTSTTYISATGWSNHQRIKQYQGGHNETWPKNGGVTINIDRNYLDVRTRPVPRAIADPTPPPTTTPAPAGSVNDPRCTSSSISKPAYRKTGPHRNKNLTAALQCLLKQRYFYKGAVTGSWGPTTRNALKAFQRSVHHKQQNTATRRDWVALITAGASNSTLRAGSHGADVVRVQRAMNAARGDRLRITGRYNKATRRAVTAYQKKVIGPSTGVVATLTWAALHRGRW